MHFPFVLILFASLQLLGLSSSGNSFGKLFRITTFGESHGGGVGVIVDGCPPRIPLTLADIQSELARRKPGQSRLTTPRKEDDIAEILSGVSSEGFTTGTPISILVRNQNQKSQDYDEFAQKYRPSHADATYDAKYGLRSIEGGGRSSARETIARVAAGAIAKKILQAYCNLEVLAYVFRVQEIQANIDVETVSIDMVSNNE
jgi:chorismate synthase